MAVQIILLCRGYTMKDVAIVGIGCRFPGGIHSPESFWSFLMNKNDGVCDMPENRWSVERFYDPDPEMPGKMYTKRGAFLNVPLDEFDPEYFGISHREAVIMDPQQRLILEVAQEALDDAGYANKVAGRYVGVYVGGFTNDSMALRHNNISKPFITTHTPTSSSYTMLSNRVSYVFDLRGPSMTIDTACSSSLVALHEAVSAIQNSEVEMAMVGGVTAMIRPETFISMCKGAFLAVDGRSKSFDKDADGYGRGEGAGMLVLRPLQAAIDDGDRIYAVIRATGVNQDGRTSGITVPNPEAQAQLIQDVTKKSRLNPADIGFIEAHGTGTAVGDPLEMEAIGNTLGNVTGREDTLYVGSIKSSIGHTEAAAGVASVIKTALSLYHGKIAPQAWLNELNPNIPFDTYKLSVPLDPVAFPNREGISAASINGFGYGGTNAHAILVNRPDPVETVPKKIKRSEKARIFPVTGRNDAGARLFAKDLAEKIKDFKHLDEVDAFSDAVWKKRVHHAYRFAISYTSPKELVEKLTELGSGGGKNSIRKINNSENIAFVLSGMGPQWWAMGRQLLTSNGVFSRVANEIDLIFQSLSGWSLIEELLKDEAESKVISTQIAQTGNFLIQVSLVAELAELGIKPSAFVGHSVGEVSAAYLSGALTLQEAIQVSYHRARLQALQAGTGGMLAVGLSEEDALKRIETLQGVSIAAVNSPSGVTLAGEMEPLEVLAGQLEQEGVFNRVLRVEVPYHSHLMDPILDELKQALSMLKPCTPTVPLYSTVTGARVSEVDEQVWGSAEYWLKNVRLPVRFADAVNTLIDDGYRAFLEVGPHPVLSGNIRELLLRRGESGASISTLSRSRDDVESLRRIASELYAVGSLNEDTPPGGWVGTLKEDGLPVHKFQKIQLWFEPEDLVYERLGNPTAPVLPGLRTASTSPEWETDINVGTLPWLNDHVVAGSILLPGAAFLDAALAAAAEITQLDYPALEDVEFISPLVITNSELPVLRMNVDEVTGRFVIRSKASDSSQDWTLRARGRIVNGKVMPKKSLAPVDHLNCETLFEVKNEQLYKKFDDLGLVYGPEFRRIERAELKGKDLVTAYIDGRVENNRHRAHPAVVDCAFQCMAVWGALGNIDVDGPVVPAAVASVRQFAPIPDQVKVEVIRCTPYKGETELVADILLMDETGETILEFTRVQFSPIAPSLPVMTELDSLFYESEFIPLELNEGLVVEDGIENSQGDLIEAALPPQYDDILFIVGVGAETQPSVSALMQLNKDNKSVTVLGAEPEEIAEQIVGDLKTFLLSINKPATIVLSAVGLGEEHGDESINHFDFQSSVNGVTALIGLAIAINDACQEIEQEQPEKQHLFSMLHGLVLTRNAMKLTGETALNLSSASLVGARRVLRNEFPEIQWRLIDLDHQTQFMDIQNLIAVDNHKNIEADEITIRADVPYIEQLKRTFVDQKAKYEEASALIDLEKNFVLEKPKTHLFSDLAFREIARRTPEDHEIEVRIEALELNSKDALKVLGILGEKELKGTYFGVDIGMQGVGVITRLGANVKGVDVGDRIVIGCKGLARRYVTTDFDDILFVKASSKLKPHDYNAMVPYLTAHYCMFYATKIVPGEVVLVHGGAGGVGMSSIQAAKLAGAQVIATASTEERRAFALQMGADHVLDSRSLNFVEDVWTLTEGRGADVIISTAPGESVSANLKAAAEFGRVLEVGKFDIFNNGIIPLTSFEKNLSFISVDIDRMVAFKPALVGQLQKDVMQLLDEGKYKPLPCHLLPISEVSQAFEMVLRSSHIGRVMLDFSLAAPLVKPAVPEAKIDRHAAYLITGGFGAFGLATARWLAEKGAGTIVLVGRNGATTPDQIHAVSALQKQGVNMVSLQANISDLESVAQLIEEVKKLGIPLKGVFHAAGVVIDSPFMFVKEESLKNVMLPKVMGAMNLHKILLNEQISLDYFVLYSSVTSITGTVPQTSYASANIVLDTLAAYRRQLGLAATVVNWGAMSGGGMAEASEEVSRYLQMIGINSIDMERACLYLDKVLGMDFQQVMLLDIDWGQWGVTHVGAASTKRFVDLVQSANANRNASNEFWQKLSLLAEEERQNALIEVLLENISQVMGIPVDSIDIHTPLPELGLDSLMGVELNVIITTALGVEISALEFTRGEGIAALASRLLKKIEAEA